MSLSTFFNRMVVVCRYFIWLLSLLFGPCRLSEFTLAGPLLNVTEVRVNINAGLLSRFTSGYFKNFILAREASEGTIK